MIEVQRLPNNQKEIYYTVTPLGKKIFQVHEVLHKRAAGEFTVCLNAYNKEELQLIDKFLGDFITIYTKWPEKMTNNAIMCFQI